MFDRGTVRPNWVRALLIPLVVLAWLAVAIVCVWLLAHIVKTILTIVFAGIVAFALAPVVSRLSRFMPRSLAIVAAYLAGFAIIATLIWFVVVTAADQVSTLVNNLNHFTNTWNQYKQDLANCTSLTTHHPLPPHQSCRHLAQPTLPYDTDVARFLGPFGVTLYSLHDSVAHLTSYAHTIGKTVATQSVDIASSILGTIVDIILVFILSVYLIANGPKIAARLKRETPGEQRRYTTLLITIVSRVVGGYIRGTLAMAALIGFVVGVGMSILQVPYAVLLGVLAFFMEFIPIIGVLVSGAVCVLVALFSGLFTALLVLGYFVIVHVIEGDVVGPRIMGKAVGIHPATAIIALVAGLELFGFWGALFGAPLAGLLQAVGTAVLAEMRGGDAEAVLHVVKEALEEAAEERTEEIIGTDGRDKQSATAEKS
jgi:predicted PurR-regulated permease PerM